ncbi:reverse transcriptase domain-containing protein [Flavobacterium sp.]|uniref:reverse transcriptase domain-containing protein n=1 Tax=Flavobacterium sp. TaxID=239 RepID=UPI003A94730B
MKNKHTSETTLPSWIKSKGYIHITPSIDVKRDWKKIERKILNKDFISKYAFYPLIHSIIIERKYKKLDSKKHVIKSKPRSHKIKELKSLKTKSSAKKRPLHYATHFDSIIYSYYAFLLQKKYEKKISETDGLSECITAYRKIRINPSLPKEVRGNGKSTIHFAKEIFDEIIQRSKKSSEVAVLAFDIKSFFSSLDHQRLKDIWCYIWGTQKMPNDHLSVFKATTDFNYILLDDLRVEKKYSGKRLGYDEKKLASIRKTTGKKCFFESNRDFRNQIKSGKLRIYKNPFYDKRKKKKIGIPQGLPISAVLANMYLYYFDLEILNILVNQNNCYYRRYSDDIIIICETHQINYVKEIIEKNMILNSVEISTDKTEVYKFRKNIYNKNGEKRLTSYKILNEEENEAPLTYLGFEFRGYNILIKSANIAKFYRRIINVIKRRAKRAKRSFKKEPNKNKAIYLNQIKKIYSTLPRKKNSENENSILKNSYKRLIKNEKGEYHFSSKEIKKKKHSNYFSYVERASQIMEEKKIKMQLRKRKHIIRTAVRKHLDKEFN